MPAGTQTRLVIVPPSEQNSATKPAACVQLKTSSSRSATSHGVAPAELSGTRTFRGRPSSRRRRCGTLKKFGAGSEQLGRRSAVDEGDVRPPSGEVLQREALVPSERPDQDADADLVDEPSCLGERRGGRPVVNSRRRAGPDGRRPRLPSTPSVRSGPPRLPPWSIRASIGSGERGVAEARVAGPCSRRGRRSQSSVRCLATGWDDGCRHPDAFGAHRDVPRHRVRPGSSPRPDSSSGRSGRRCRRPSWRPRRDPSPTATPSRSAPDAHRPDDPVRGRIDAGDGVAEERGHPHGALAGGDDPPERTEAGSCATTRCVLGSMRQTVRPRASPATQMDPRPDANPSNDS